MTIQNHHLLSVILGADHNEVFVAIVAHIVEAYLRVGTTNQRKDSIQRLTILQFFSFVIMKRHDTFQLWITFETNVIDVRAVIRKSELLILHCYAFLCDAMILLLLSSFVNSLGQKNFPYNTVRLS